MIARPLGLLLLLLAPALLAQEAKPDPLEAEVAALEAADQKAPPPKGGILFLGSSSVRMWDLAAAFPGRPCVNRGFGGSQLADAVRFVPRLVAPHQPKVVVVYAGDNDLAAKKTPAQVVDDYGRLVEALRKAVPEVRVVFIGIKPSPNRWKLIEQGREANRGIRALVEKDPGQRFLDVEKPMLGEDGQPRPELYAKDGLHLSPAGFELWTKLLAPVLDEVAGAAPAAPAAGPDAFKPLVGQTLDAATAWLKAHPTASPGHPGTNVTVVRPIRIDGEDLIVTEDLRADRVNVVVEDGKISAIEGVR